MTDAAPEHGPAFDRRLTRAGLCLGFALGGFFDGILLHQILQWHHLLSALDGAAFRDVRVQVVADGLFHAAMYVVGIVGLWLLWRARRSFAAPGADRRVLADALIGFGSWHVIDGVLSHWITGIHRIRMDSDAPLLWDLTWFLVFGVAVVAAGYALRRGRGGASGGGFRRTAAPALLGVTTLAAGAVAGLPPRGVTTVAALFPPGTGPEAAFAAVNAAGGRAVWSDPSGQLWLVDLGPGGHKGRLYRRGALLVGASPFVAGCLAFSRA